MSNATYGVSLVKWKHGTENGTPESFMVHAHDPMGFGETGDTQSAEWLTTRLRRGCRASTLGRSIKGKWFETGPLALDPKGILSWSHAIPVMKEKRKVFVSFYHAEDREKFRAFAKITSDLFVNKSVAVGAISPDANDVQVKQHIQRMNLADSTVIVVLVGPNTRFRKHVDWEIHAGLNHRVGGIYAGLVALLLPSHPDFQKARVAPSNLPARLADNIASGYAVRGDWTTDRWALQRLVEQAFTNRRSMENRRNNARPQMPDDLPPVTRRKSPP